MNTSRIQVETPGYAHEEASAARIEQQLEASLDLIPGLSSASSVVDRARIFADAVHEQREAFIAKYGCPFGGDVLTRKRSKPSTTLQPVD